MVERTYIRWGAGKRLLQKQLFSGLKLAKFNLALANSFSKDQASPALVDSAPDHQIYTVVLAEAEPDTSPKPTQSFLLEKPLREARDEFEKADFEFHLFWEGGSMTRVAEKTGLERTHLYRKLKQLGVDLTRGKRPT